MVPMGDIYRQESAMTLSAVGLRIGQFLEKVENAKRRVLLLDYDGTLAPFMADRESASPYQGVPELLDYLMRICRTEVVLVSGRSVTELLPVLGDRLHPEIWGSNGLERFERNGAYKRVVLNHTMDLSLQTATAWMEKEGFGELLELKVGGVALHWRGCSANIAKEAQLAAARVWAPLTGNTGLQLLDFDQGIELRVARPNKGDAVLAILTDLADSSAVAYLGHDCADEDAFRVLRGRALTVLIRSVFRPSEAEIWLKPPGEMLGFLNAWLLACDHHLER